MKVGLLAGNDLRVRYWCVVRGLHFHEFYGWAASDVSKIVSRLHWNGD